MSKVLEVKNISKYFLQGSNKLSILENACLDINAGECLALLGDSGCGKTTLLQILGLLDKADSGTIQIAGRMVGDLSDKKRTNERLNNLGFIYQFHNLMHEFTALENVVMPLFLQKYSTKNAYLEGEKILTELGLKDRLHHKPAALSGGEQQRVAIARAVIHKPKLILADEPTGNLDPQNAKKVFSLLYDTVKSRNIAALIVTHNHQLAEYSDKVITIKERQIESLEKEVDIGRFPNQNHESFSN